MKTIKKFLAIFILVVFAASIVTAALPAKNPTKTTMKLGSSASVNQSNITSSAVGNDASRITLFKWVGRDADKVGTADNGTPDGHPDGHFILSVHLPMPTEIKYIAIYSAGPDGKPAGGQIWHSADKYWILGVFNQGKQLDKHHVPSLGKFSGDVKFDLYASDSGWFLVGKRFLGQIGLANGTQLQNLTII